MLKTLRLVLSPQQAGTESLLKEAAASASGLSQERIHTLLIRKRSIDARSKQVKVLLEVDVYSGKDEADFSPFALKLQQVEHAVPVLIIGSGPAGLFGALRLIELGFKPIILERGKDVSARKRDIASLSRNLGLDPESNYCYGEGGAGTFSDGKLYTRSNKRGDIQRILRIFHAFGAPSEIIFDAHPHIGTNILPRVIRNIREQIIACGGEVHFDHCVQNIRTNVTGVELLCTNNTIWEAPALLLASGHSAQNIYEIFSQNEWLLEPKGFAMGVRAEHPQKLIDQIQYHQPIRDPFLPAASYSVVSQIAGRGVYSFCMCPGGYIVNASTQAQQCVVNGMSSSSRHTPYANSGIVVQILPEDIPSQFQQQGVLGGLFYQRHLEHMAYAAVEQVMGQDNTHQQAPAQRMQDFIRNRKSTSLPESSYLQGLVSSELNLWLPQGIKSRLQQGFQSFDQKMKGYLSPEALIVGVESRSSSPIRIPRDKMTFQHPQHACIFPCGEGAGYAGGITSSAMDGEACADQISNYLKSKV